MSCQTPVISRDPAASSDVRGKASGRSVTSVPYDPSFETPDEGGLSGRLTGASIRTRVSPAEYSWPFLSPGAFSSLDSRGSFALRSVPRVAGVPAILIHLN